LDSTIAQIIFAFVMIGLFALVLRWTFSGGPAQDRAQPEEPPTLGGLGAESPHGIRATCRVPPLDRHGEPTLSAPVDDYGLLAPAAIVETPEQAARMRTLLSQAGIRATTTIGADGRHRVLVFARDLHRARRVAGSSG
jgi:hypothetical protein